MLAFNLRDAFYLHDVYSVYRYIRALLLLIDRVGCDAHTRRPVSSRFGGDDGRPVRNIDGSLAVGAVGREV
jgi:hypothetical protein